MVPDTPLKLRAEDVDDLAVISAVAQDALISVKDLVYDRGARSFTVVANRFRWESRPASANGTPTFARTLCAVTFGAVDGVSYRGFRRSEEDRILSLLAIQLDAAPSDGKPGTINLAFSGGGTVRLNVATIDCRAIDVGEPWPTAWQPDHEAGLPGDEPQP